MTLTGPKYLKNAHVYNSKATTQSASLMLSGCWICAIQSLGVDNSRAMDSGFEFVANKMRPRILGFTMLAQWIPNLPGMRSLEPGSLQSEGHGFWISKYGVWFLRLRSSRAVSSKSAYAASRVWESTLSDHGCWLRKAVCQSLRKDIQVLSS